MEPSSDARDARSSVPHTPPHTSVSRMRLPAHGLAASAARDFVRAVLAEQGAPSGGGARAESGDGDRRAARAGLGEGGTTAGTEGSAAARFADDAALLASEAVTSAVAGAEAEVEVVCRVETRPRTATPASAPAPGGVPRALVVEVVDRHPSPAAQGDGSPAQTAHTVHGHGLRILQALTESWGVTHRGETVSTWFRLTAPESGTPPSSGSPATAAPALAPPGERPAAPAVPGAADIQSTPGTPGTESGTPQPGAAQDGGARDGSTPHGGPGLGTAQPRAARGEQHGTSFLAEAGELLAGQLDEDMVAVAAGQLMVPRLADWCAVWLTTERGGMRLSRVWHVDERRLSALRRALEDEQPPARLNTTGIPWPWPGGLGTGGSALAFPLVAGGRCHGTVILGREGGAPINRGSARLAEDVVRHVAQAVVTARHYARQAAISSTLQRSQLPESLARIPGVDTAIVYEPYGEGQTVGGDFYDVFPISDRRWSFLLGDVCGHDLEAVSSTGLARHLVRLLAREGRGIESLLGKLNEAMTEESAEAMAIEGEQAGQRFLSLLYGELETDPARGIVHCALASAGHPLPLRLSADGTVTTTADPQLLLGIDEYATFHANSFDLTAGEILLCVTDGVTERRRGDRLLDDEGGLADVLRGCVGLGARAVADRVRQAAHDFAPEPVDDDLAVLVLEATPVLEGRAARTGRP